MVTAGSDEFRFLNDTASKQGLPAPLMPVVRVHSPMNGGSVSALQWGTSSPRLVFLHGLGQNAHTFDTVALTLHEPLLSVDLPGHGWSSATPPTMVTLDDVVQGLCEALAPLRQSPAVLVGMSLGGLCAIALAQLTPSWWSHLVLLDCTPSITPDKARTVTDFLDGPTSFDSFDDMLSRTIAFNPTRSPESLARGVALNAREREDGRWVWHHQAHQTRLRPQFDAEQLWGTLSDLPLPVSLLHGTRGDSAVDVRDIEHFCSRRPGDRVRAVEGAGHALQGEAPEAVAAYLDLVLRPSTQDR